MGQPTSQECPRPKWLRSISSLVVEHSNTQFIRERVFIVQSGVLSLLSPSIIILIEMLVKRFVGGARARSNADLNREGLGLCGVSSAWNPSHGNRKNRAARWKHLRIDSGNEGSYKDSIPEASYRLPPRVENQVRSRKDCRALIYFWRPKDGWIAVSVAWKKKKKKREERRVINVITHSGSCALCASSLASGVVQIVSTSSC